MLNPELQARIEKFFTSQQGAKNMFVIDTQQAVAGINSLVFELKHRGMDERAAVDQIDQAMCLIKPEPAHTSAITRFRSIVSEYGMETAKRKIRRSIQVPS